jgi:hypothetical protein
MKNSLSFSKFHLSQGWNQFAKVGINSFIPQANLKKVIDRKTLSVENQLITKKRDDG